MAPYSDLVRRQDYYGDNGYGWWGYSEVGNKMSRKTHHTNGRLDCFHY